MPEVQLQTSISFRLKLLTTVSAAALVVAVASDPARAEDRPSWVILELNSDNISGDSQDWVFDGGTPANQQIRPDDGYSGKVGFVTPLQDTPYDIGIFARYGDTERDRDTATAGLRNLLGGAVSGTYTAGRASHTEEHAIIDFEARRDIGFGADLGATKVTARGGLRFGYFDAETKTNFSQPIVTVSPNALSEKRRSRFIGAGPMLGLDTLTPLTEHIQIDLSATGALLLGDRQRRVNANQTVGGAGNVKDDSHSFRVVPMLEANAALGITPMGPGGMVVSVGVRGEAWFDVHDQRTKFNPGGTGSLGDSSADRYSWGPFIRVKIPFGGN